MVVVCFEVIFFFFSSRRRHTRFDCDWSSDVCSSDLPICCPETTDPILYSTCKSPLFMTKKFTFQQCFCKGCTVNLNKWVILTYTIVMYSPGYQLFTSTGFALN